MLLLPDFAARCRPVQMVNLAQRVRPRAGASAWRCRNDGPMLKAAALGIAVLGSEGLAMDAVRDADLLVRHIVDGIGLLLHPARLIASMRAWKAGEQYVTCFDAFLRATHSGAIVESSPSPVRTLVVAVTRAHQRLHFIKRRN